MGSRAPWPPCRRCNCIGEDCFHERYFHGCKKLSWPELIGVDAKIAKPRIERENPYVTAVITQIAIFDICCNRVWIYADANGKVRAPAPMFNKSHNTHDYTFKKSSITSVPECMEFISAMAAGNRAQLMVEITSNGISLMTIALAIAAKQIGGRLICILLLHDQDIIKEGKTRIQSYGLDEYVIEIIVTENPCEMMKTYRSIDFAVIDCKIEDHLKLCKVMDLNKERETSSVVVMRNIDHLNRGGGTGGEDSHAQVFKGRGGFESVNNLVIGEGLELMRLSGGTCTSSCNRHESSRRYKRFYMTIEN